MTKTRAEIVLGQLKDIDSYLAHFTPKESTYFEKLIAEVLSRALHLPFYSLDNENTNKTYRLTWQGSIGSITPAPPGADAIAYCYSYYLLIEATRRTGANQWKLEVVQAIRHCEDFCRQNRIDPKDVFVVLVCKELHIDTYRSIRRNPDTEYKLIPMGIPEVIKILETSILAFTMRHLRVRKLFASILKAVRETSSLTDFQSTLGVVVSDWQKDVLREEKIAFTGVRSYELIRTIRRREVALSEILTELQKHPTVKKYFDIIGANFLSGDLVEDSLVQTGYASCVGFTFDEEPLFLPVPWIDFKVRNNKLVRKVRKMQ